MADRPILFSAPMVCALLAGTKTQTRRAIKKPPALDALTVFGPRFLLLPANADLLSHAVGDRLWVREAHYMTDDGDNEVAVYAADGADVAAHFDQMTDLERRYPGCDWSKHRRLRPGIHMPRWASRITLTVTEVRVQRLQDISEEDAWAEGCRLGEPWDSGQGFFPAEEPSPDGHGWLGWDDAREWYSDLWDQINGPGAWESNPWVAAYSFTVRLGNIDAEEVQRG